MTRKTKYPATCPAFATAQLGHVFYGSPSEVDNLSGVYDEERDVHYAVTHCIPLTPVALLMYATVGGDEESFATALSHKRGRKPTRLYDDAERYVDRADARGEGY